MAGTIREGENAARMERGMKLYEDFRGFKRDQMHEERRTAHARNEVIQADS
jgi:hypothetical protein